MRVLVLGATGFLGHWVVEKLKSLKQDFFILQSSLSFGVDLRDSHETHRLFIETKPDYVINCAAYVGGIQYGRMHPAEIYHNNMLMILNIFAACAKFSIKRLIQPISNCAYPARENFFQEDNFWSGPLHESVLAYGMTRKTMVVGAWAYQKQYSLDTVSLILSNMYGPYDHFDEIRSHAAGAIIKKIVKAQLTNEKTVVIWGSGKPVREWLYVEDGAEAMVKAINIESHDDIINIGSGYGVSIAELAIFVKDAVGWDGTLIFDTTKQDGACHKTVDGTKGEKLLNWKPKTLLLDGIKKTIEWYTKHYKEEG